MKRYDLPSTRTAKINAYLAISELNFAKTSQIREQLGGGILRLLPSQVSTSDIYFLSRIACSYFCCIFLIEKVDNRAKGLMHEPEVMFGSRLHWKI